MKRELDFLNLENVTQPNACFPNNFSNPLQMTDDLTNRMPLDLSSFGNVCKFEVVKNDIVPYLVKYKLQDGKHVKMWQCKTCKLPIQIRIRFLFLIFH